MALLRSVKGGAFGNGGLLANVRISRQINLLAIASAAGFLVVCAGFYLESLWVENMREEEAEAIEAATVAEGVKYDFLNARRREKDFLIRLDAKYAAAQREVVDSALAGLDRLRSMHTEAEIQQMIDQIKTGTKRYAGQFDLVAGSWEQLGLSENDGLRGSLRKSVHEVETKLKDFENDKLAVTMLMMRRHEKDFMARLAPKYVGQMAERAGEFAAQLDASTIPAEAKADIASRMADYQKDFKAFAERRLLVEKETQVLSEIFAEIDPLLSQVVDDSEEDRAIVVAETKQISRYALFAVVGFVLVVLVLVQAMARLISRGVSKPVVDMTRAMTRLADKDMSADIPALGWRNEIGQMASAVSVFKENMITADRLAEEQRRQQEAQAARAKRIEDLCLNFDAVSTKTVKAVASASTEMRSSSESMSATAEEATRQSAAVAAASEQASANVQTVATAAEELSSSISEIARQAGQASQIASEAAREAERTNAKIQGLAEAADKIGEVVSLITDIADQTNLLALNATIEAARAGDAGKGFAVVASEVKNLANQTAKATDEIGGQIAGIQTATQDAVAAIKSITKTISEINEVASGIASAVEQQGAATQEIARNVEQAAVGTQEVSSNISGVSQAANDTGTAASQIQSAAGELSQQSETLRAAVDKFLTDVRAA